MALDELYRRRKYLLILNSEQSERSLHGKALLSMFEGFTIALMWYILILDDMSDMVNVPVPTFLFVVLIPIELATAGFALLSLDMVLSSQLRSRVFRHWWTQVWNLTLHFMFRTVEVWSRVAMFTICVMLTFDIPEVPLLGIMFVDIVVTSMLIRWHAGCEEKWGVRLVCVLPCMFADIFLFIDSPYKRRAALQLSRVIVARNFIELALIAIYLYVFESTYTTKFVLRAWHHHNVLVFSGLVAIIFYPVFLLFVVKYRVSKKIDIFTACANGSATSVAALTTEAAIGFSIDCRDVFDMTPLMVASRYGHAEVVALLLSEDATVDCKRRGTGGGCSNR
eukprot:CAMPEP_0194539698 /NCGR_PEP_ID=MMETSP0253-20130528/79720_1 /TAXON_ID=2966 /ORGANISM="Noctiluca scintillans" /LENGTH=336 /DNA_ID=CAMNT_0039386001 /DNA_START=259 /DNA_END=1266 /DNA_ORIENTATION=-